MEGGRRGRCRCFDFQGFGEFVFLEWVIEAQFDTGLGELDFVFLEELYLELDFFIECFEGVIGSVLFDFCAAGEVGFGDGVGDEDCLFCGGVFGGDFDEVGSADGGGC